jgi:hypothetical protein
MMNERLLELLAGLYPTVTDEDPNDPPAGGGATATTDDDDDDDEALGEAGKKTLTKLRDELKAANRRLKQVEGLDPRIFKQATEKAEQLERELREREALTAADRMRLEKKANDQVAEAKQEAERERQARIRLQTRTLAQNAFTLAKGRSGADDDGRSFLDGFMALVGEKHLRIDDNGDLFVVDGQNDPIPSPDGKGRISPDAWMKQLADKSPVIGTFFEPAMGSGSGMPSSRGASGRNLPALKDLTPGQRRDLAWNSNS